MPLARSATARGCERKRARYKSMQAPSEQFVGRSITEVCQLTVKEARPFFDSLKLSPAETVIADKVLEEIQQRLRFLDEVGLDYLTLDRLTSTLSGGETQRIQLATSLGSNLVGALYVLDEPSIGLHPRDTNRLIQILKGLRDLGNTLVVVEHDPDTILAADNVMDLGPGAGEHGGKLIFSGTREAMLADPHSLTGRYLRGELRIPVPQRRRRPYGRFLKIFGARSHNLKNVDVVFPLGMLVAVTGVSGSGKSTLVYDVLYKALQAKRTGGNFHEFCARIEGDNNLTEVEMVDQSPIGRTPRSNPVTYIKAFDIIREAFRHHAGGRKAGLYARPLLLQYYRRPMRNVPGRRHGNGRDAVSWPTWNWFAKSAAARDTSRACWKCITREPEYSRSSADDRSRGALFFRGHPKVAANLKVLEDVGLGYLRLGQSATTLCGGEAQRVKLAAHLAQSNCEGTLYPFRRAYDRAALRRYRETAGRISH